MSYVTPARLGQFKTLQDQFNETKFGKVKTINDISPDKNGNVLIGLATTTSNGLLSKEDKEKIANLHTVSTTGSYNDLINKPSIPVISNTYSAATTNGMSGKAVASALTKYYTQTEINNGFYTKTADDAMALTNDEIDAAIAGV